MYKNVLIISDNFYLSKKFLEIIEEKKIPSCHFTFSISPFSKKEEFIISNSIDVKVFDLKKVEDINIIKNNYDLIFSIHCKQIFPAELIDNIKCINIHPGFNPINRGWYPQVFSIINNYAVGATIHEIDEKLDHGNIIAREFVVKSNFDTSETLYNKIVAKEIELLNENLENIILNRYTTTRPEGEGNLYLKKDFNNLLELNLEEKTTIGELINRLRALTHGEYNNAYFYDFETKKKIFVGINLTLEK